VALAAHILTPDVNRAAAVCATGYVLAPVRREPSTGHEQWLTEPQARAF
jgi:hypothetical protein